MDVNMKNLFIGNDLSPLPFSASQSCQECLQRFGYVSAINPVFALEIIKSEKLTKIAEEVAVKLQKVIEKIAKGEY